MTNKLKRMLAKQNKQARRDAIRLDDDKFISGLSRAIRSKHNVKTNGKSLSRFARDEKFHGFVWEGIALSSMKNPKGNKYVKLSVRTWVKKDEK